MATTEVQHHSVRTRAVKHCNHDHCELMKSKIKTGGTVYYLKCLDCGDRMQYRDNMQEVVQRFYSNSSPLPAPHFCLSIKQKDERV